MVALKFLGIAHGIFNIFGRGVLVTPGFGLPVGISKCVKQEAVYGSGSKQLKECSKVLHLHTFFWTPFYCLLKMGIFPKIYTLWVLKPCRYLDCTISRLPNSCNSFLMDFLIPCPTILFFDLFFPKICYLYKTQWKCKYLYPLSLLLCNICLVFRLWDDNHGMHETHILLYII